VRIAATSACFGRRRARASPSPRLVPGARRQAAPDREARAAGRLRPDHFEAERNPPLHASPRQQPTIRRPFSSAAEIVPERKRRGALARHVLLVWPCRYVRTCSGNALGLAKRDEQTQKGRFESDLLHIRPLRFTKLRAWQICRGPLLADQVVAERWLVTRAGNRARRSPPAPPRGCCGAASGRAPRRFASPADRRRDDARAR